MFLAKFSKYAIKNLLFLLEKLTRKIEFSLCTFWEVSINPNDNNPTYGNLIIALALFTNINTKLDN